MTFFVPQIFTGVAFDSGGVASGPMTTTFLLPLAMGACEALGGNVLTDAFGIVALVINWLFMELASWLAVSIFGVGVTIDGFWWSVLGSLIMSIVSAIVGAVIGD